MGSVRNVLSLRSNAFLHLPSRNFTIYHHTNGQLKCTKGNGPKGLAQHDAYSRCRYNHHSLPRIVVYAPCFNAITLARQGLPGTPSNNKWGVSHPPSSLGLHFNHSLMQIVKSSFAQCWRRPPSTMYHFI